MEPRRRVSRHSRHDIVPEAERHRRLELKVASNQPKGAKGPAKVRASTRLIDALRREIEAQDRLSEDHDNHQDDGDQGEPQESRDEERVTKEGHDEGVSQINRLLIHARHEGTPLQVNSSHFRCCTHALRTPLTNDAELSVE